MSQLLLISFLALGCRNVGGGEESDWGGGGSGGDGGATGGGGWDTGSGDSVPTDDFCGEHHNDQSW